MHRLREAYNTISADYPATPGVPDDLTISMQTGNRIGYHPQTARAEIEAFLGQYAAVVSATETALNDIKRLTDADRASEHQAHLQRALAVLYDAQ
jgi:hypothetical protein